VCVSKGSSLFWCKESQICSCMRKAKFCYEEESLYVSAGKGRDCVELLRIQVRSVQAFLTACTREASEFSVSQTNSILYKSTLL